MRSNSMLILLFCYVITAINALENCSGPSVGSQEDLPWKFNASPIVVYGQVTEANGTTLTLKISCVLKGPFTESTIQLDQAASANNSSECHYLTANKNYIVFIEPSKTVTLDDKIVYQLMNLEEIEVTASSLAEFLDNGCGDEDDYGIPMTIFYADINDKCSQFQATCNENTKRSILDLSYSPLTKTSTYIGGIKYPLGVPKMDHAETEVISSKQNVGAGDETLRATATASTVSVPIVLIITSFTLLLNH